MAFPLPDKPSIAVLPFDNMSEDPTQVYFSDGLSDQIISSLSKLPNLFVIARNSTFTYKGKPVKVQKVAEDLGVRYVLEGSVQKSADRVRITAQLIDAITGRHKWSERYDRDLEDIFAIQDDIAMAITKALNIELIEGEQARAYEKGTTTNLKAYLKYLEGMSYYYRLTKEDNTRARQLFKEALALDPGYANAYVLLGTTHWYDARYGWVESRGKSIETAYKYAQKAIELNDTLDTAHLVIGVVYLLKRQHEKNIAQGKRALALNPNGAWNHMFLAGALGCAGKWEESLGYAEKAMRLSPFPTVAYYWLLGRSYFMTGQYDKAIETFKKAVHVNPDYLVAHAFLAACYSALDRQAEAAVEAEEVLRINPKFTLESYARTLPYKNKIDIERYIAALRKAGLPETPPLPLPDKPSIAVLPFVNMSGDPEQEYFSDGISEQIITSLSKVSNLFVIARTSSFKYKGKEVDVRGVGRELGVRYVLEGSVQKSGDRVRITAQLVDASTGRHLWAERYDRDLKDTFALQDEITMKIIAAMQLKLTEGETAKLHLKGTDNLEAYTKWLQAHFYFNQYTPDDNVRARKLAEQVIALDPGYPAGYSLLALIQVLELFYNPRKATKETIQDSIKLAKKALSMDDSDPLSHVALGRIYFMIRQFENAIVELNQALTLNPNLVEANRWLGFALIGVGKPEEALPFIRKALRLNPVEKGRTAALGLVYRKLGRYEEAIEAYKEVVRFRPNHLFAHMGLVICYVALDKEEAAHGEATKVFQINPTYPLENLEKHMSKDEPALIPPVLSVLRKAGLK
jgi:TolB-like protein/Flp pilus assembly protein TadD